MEENNTFKIETSFVAPGQIWLIKMPRPDIITNYSPVYSTEFIAKSRFFVVLQVYKDSILTIPLSSTEPSHKHDIVINNSDVGIKSQYKTSTIRCGCLQRLDKSRFTNPSSYLLTNLSRKSFISILSVVFASIIDGNLHDGEIGTLVDGIMEYNASNTDPNNLFTFDIENPYGMLYSRLPSSEDDNEYSSLYKFMNGYKLQDCTPADDGDSENSLENISE